MTQNENTKPVHEICIGSVKAAIWARQSETGDTFHAVTVSRFYKKDDKWNYTDSFRRDDLLVLRKVLDQAHSWIIEAQAPWQDDEPAQ